MQYCNNNIAILLQSKVLQYCNITSINPSSAEVLQYRPAFGRRSMATLQAIRYERDESSTQARLSVLDQLLLPDQTVYIPIANTADGWDCVKKMQVRGAPALAIVSMLSLAVELLDPASDLHAAKDLRCFAALVRGKLEFLKTSRPTAVNLAEAADRMSAELQAWVAEDGDGGRGETVGVEEARRRLVAEIEAMLPLDVTTNRNIGAHGGDFLLAQALRCLPAEGDVRKAMRAALLAAGGDCCGEGGEGGGGGGGDGAEGGVINNKATAEEATPPRKGLRVITHCNTGSLATAQYGTALGVARWLNERGLLETLFCTETRPYNQGARLSVYECIVDRIPHCLVTDSMVAALMASRRIDAVVVGADRVVANGDTANKVGTHQLAILARHFRVPFYVAAPLTSLDAGTAAGSDIVIEERPAVELTATARAPEGACVWNPAFDVTPAELIDAIFTEHGVITKPVRAASASATAAAAAAATAAVAAPAAAVAAAAAAFDVVGFVGSRKGAPKSGVACECHGLSRLRGVEDDESNCYR